MNKYLFSLAVGASMLTACTSEEVIDISKTQGNVISFENVVNKSSRAVEGNLTNTSFNNFMVYGYYLKPNMSTPVQTFNGVLVHKTQAADGTVKWSYDGTRYWVPGCTYYFYAYSCADVAIASSYGTTAFSLFDGNNSSVDGRALVVQNYLCDQNHQHDLVTAEHENIVATEKGNPDVSLAFSHALCKIRAVFSTDFPVGYKIYVSNVYVTDFYNRADYNVGTGNWENFTNTNDATPASVLLTVPDKSFVENKTGSKVETTEAFIIPKAYDTFKYENVKLHFTITIMSGNETILERSIVGTWSPQWQKGNIYKYNINITGSSAGIEPIIFAAEQTLSGNSSWDDSTQLDMIFGIDANI